MADHPQTKLSRLIGRRRRALLGAVIIVLIATGAASVGYLLVAKGVGPALPIMGIVVSYSLALVRYWFWTKKNANDEHEEAESLALRPGRGPSNDEL